MAMVKYSAHIDTIRGSIQNTTYSRNRPGNFMRLRAVPRDPASLKQLLQRATHATIVDRWRNTLNDDERIVWNDLALLTTFSSATCRAYHPSGFSLYLRCNVFRLAMGQAIVDVPDAAAAAAPTTFTLGHGPEPGYCHITATADWEDGKTGFWNVWASRICSPSTYYYRGPWYASEDYTIANLTAPGLPFSLPAPDELPAGKRRFHKFKAVYGTQGTIVTWTQHAYCDRPA